MSEQHLYKIVQHIFSNWTGLKLAVEHSMGGPNSKQLAIDCIEEITQFCLDEPSLDQESLEDFLEDMMDEKFDTIFEDGSPKEIATILFQFVQLLKSGNVEKCEEEFQKLPTSNTNWLEQSRTSIQYQAAASSSDDDQQSTDVQMEEDDGWTVVQNRKKK